MRAPGPQVEPVEIPAGALLRLAALFPDRYPALLDSAAQGPLSRTTLLAALPRAALRLDAGGAGEQGGFLDALDAAWRAAAAEAPGPPAAPELPFTGGWIVYLGYELALQIEPSLAAHWPSANHHDQRPVACALRIPAVLVQESSGRGWLVTEAQVSAAERRQIRADLHAAARAELPQAPPLESVEEEPARYIERVQRAQQYIAAGDIYQANLSRRWQAQLPEDFSAAALYSRLRGSNPAPFAALLQLDDFRVLSSSPERLLRIRGRRVDTRPIAGTYPRGATPEADRRLAAALVAHPKERAEHVMLIDLARNDLGRVCTGGSVRVDEYMAVETYAHVHHLVSNVTGELRSDVSPAEVLRAVFPGGTITGCPKVRCMQIIAELEGAPRGPYTGSLGYLNHDGSGDFNILIRTLSLQGRQLELRAGAGIVADSDPQRELAETRAKARGMLLALRS
ncbi:MAG: aminodeoxychorismate synthase component I [Steroidobacteraceae bacterium]